MDNFNIDEFINKINAIEIDKSDEEWFQKFNEEFDKQVSKSEITNFIEAINKMDDQTFNKIISGMDGTKFEKLMSKINVKNFTEIINKMNGVTVLTEKDKESFIADYLEKMQNLLEDRKRENVDSTIEFLHSNLERNVKCVVNAEYSKEEKAIKESEYEGGEVDNESLEYKSMARKTAIGAKPGQYVQGRIVFSNLPKNNILRYHETTHAARNEIFDKNGNKIAPADRIDNLMTVNNTYDFLKQFPNTSATAGYDFSEIDEKGRASGEKGGPKLTRDYFAMSDLMEICTETIAGLMNDHSDKNVRKFEVFWVPQRNMEMSAISFFRDARDLLIMAIGSDSFIFDMLEPNAINKIKNLNEKMNQYKNGASIGEYLEIAGEHATLEGKIEQNKQKEFVKKRRDSYLKILKDCRDRGDIFSENYNKVLAEYKKCSQAIANGEEERYVEDRMNEYRFKMESYASDMFLSRMENCQDIDKDAQIDFFKNILKNREVENQVELKTKNKISLGEDLVSIDDMKAAYESTNAEQKRKRSETVKADVREEQKNKQEGEITYE